MAILLIQPGEESNEILERFQRHLVDRARVPLIWLPGDKSSRFIFSTPFVSCSCRPGSSLGWTSFSIIFKEDKADFTGMKLYFTRDGFRTSSLDENISQPLNHHFQTHFRGFFRIALVRPSPRETEKILKRIQEEADNLTEEV